MERKIIEKDVEEESPYPIYVNVCKCKCLHLMGIARTEWPHLAAVVCNPPSMLVYEDSRCLLLHANQFADCLLVNPVWLRVPLAATLTAPNTKASSSSEW